ncbi:MAG: transposase [Janthinobacterium lividum]
MWTREHRARQAAFAHRRRHPADLRDEEWERTAPFLPAPAGRGRLPKADLREALNAIRHTVRSGGGWRMLPVHFGPWQTPTWRFRRFVRRLLFHTVHDIAPMLDREQAGREAGPSAWAHCCSGVPPTRGHPILRRAPR